MKFVFKTLLFTCCVAALPSATFSQNFLEPFTSAAGTTLAEAIRHSRNSMIGQSKPIPTDIREQLKDFFPDSVLDRAKFKIGDDGTFNVARNTLFNESVAAVALDDVIVFRSIEDSQSNILLWAHELKHVHQYEEWGLNSFATQYVRNSDAVENEAKNYHARFERTLTLIRTNKSGYGCSTAREVVGHLYRSILQRDGDEAGIRHHTLLLNTGKISVRNLVGALFSSKEHQNKFAAGRSSEDQVRLLYRHILGREPDPEGFKVNTGALNARGYEAVVKAFVQSQEY